MIAALHLFPRCYVLAEPAAVMLRITGSEIGCFDRLPATSVEHRKLYCSI